MATETASETRTRPLADARCGMNRQIVTLLAAMSMEEIEEAHHHAQKSDCEGDPSGLRVTVLTALADYIESTIIEF